MSIKSSKKDIKANKGITLIALVITIIVLLILAGVAIATLTGDNGLLQRAGEVKNKNAEVIAMEKIQVEVAGSYGLDGEIDIEQLNTNLQHIKGLKYNEMELNNTNKIKEIPLVVKFQGELIKINEDGSVSKQLMSINSLEKTKYYINAAGRVGTINDRTYYKKK